VPFDSAGLKTTEKFPFPVECRLVAQNGHGRRIGGCPLLGE
jgi:hypothetical protein